MSKSSITPNFISGCLTDPFLSYVLTGVKQNITDDPSCTAQTDGETITFGSVWFEKIKADPKSFMFEEDKKIGATESERFCAMVQTVTAHELMHVMLNHPYRGGTLLKGIKSLRDKKLMHSLINCVYDAIINENLRNNKYLMPNMFVFLTSLLSEEDIDRHPQNWTEEELLLYILKFNSQKQKENCQQQGANDSNNSDVVYLPSGGILQKENEVVIYVSEDGSVQIEINNDVIISNPEFSEAQLEKIKDLIEGASNRVNTYYPSYANKSSSLCKQFIIANANRYKTEPINWAELLLREINSNFKNSYKLNPNRLKDENFYGYVTGMTPLSRCAIESPLELQVKPNLLVIILDLSGSIFCDEALLGKFMDQINHISEHVEDVLLITFDVGIINCFEFAISQIKEGLGNVLIQDNKKYLAGGGGTDICPVFDDLNQGLLQYEDLLTVDVSRTGTVVVFTDLEFYKDVSNSLEPEAPVIWVSTKQDYSNSSKRSSLPSFGTFVTIEES